MLNNSSYPPPPNQSPRVLALDDEPQICKLLSRCLTPHYNVACVTDTDAAITSIAEHCPDLIFVDVHLGCRYPNGITFVWQLRENKYTGIICMLSGDRTQETILSALIAGANEYLVKSEIAENIRAEVDLLLSTGQTNINTNNYVRESGRLRSEGLSDNQRKLLADWATTGMPDLPDLAKKYNLSVQTLSKRFLRIQNKLGLENRAQLSSLMTTVLGFGERQNRANLK